MRSMQALWDFSCALYRFSIILRNYEMRVSHIIASKLGMRACRGIMFYFYLTYMISLNLNLRRAWCGTDYIFVVGDVARTFHFALVTIELAICFNSRVELGDAAVEVNIGSPKKCNMMNG